MASFLVIGRNADKTRHLKKVLKEQGHTVTVAHYYRTVLHHIRKGNVFDIIVCDHLDDYIFTDLTQNVRTLLAPKLMFIPQSITDDHAAQRVSAIRIAFIQYNYYLEIWDEIAILAEIDKNKAKLTA